ncbi:ASCH domain-containing protein [Variovorax sp. YR752]|uniref:ASCH domain-containing protein n=1 Tax=Variovorax sp. YR752 TaxID=1884383 RepID=UPI003137717B
MARPDDPPAPGRSDEIEAFWLAYQRECGVKVEGFSATALGPTRALADELALLVGNGVKRAHATLRREFEKDLEALPAPGEHVVVLDGAGHPRAIVRNTHVELRHFNQIDDEFAFNAGEGDLTLRWWLVAHRQQWSEQAEREGFEIGETSELVLEFFELVWPRPEQPADSAAQP